MPYARQPRRRAQFICRESCHRARTRDTGASRSSSNAAMAYRSIDRPGAWRLRGARAPAVVRADRLAREWASRVGMASVAGGRIHSSVTGERERIRRMQINRPLCVCSHQFAMLETFAPKSYMRRTPDVSRSAAELGCRQAAKRSRANFITRLCQSRYRRGATRFPARNAHTSFRWPQTKRDAHDNDIDVNCPPAELLPGCSAACFVMRHGAAHARACHTNMTECYSTPYSELLCTRVSARARMRL